MLRLKAAANLLALSYPTVPATCATLTSVLSVSISAARIIRYEVSHSPMAVSYTHLTLPTTPYV